MSTTNISAYLVEHRLLLQDTVSSKKRALELLSELLANDVENVSETEIFDGFIARERLGSTALGDGTAIPHCRLENIDHIYCAGLKLEHGVDYESPDGSDVTILFGIVVPAEANDEHLQVLAQLAEFLSKPVNREKVRNCQNRRELYNIIISLTNTSSSKVNVA